MEKDFNVHLDILPFPQRKLWGELVRTPKDYLDIDALLTLGELPLNMILACESVIYGKAFNPFITLKALCYYDDPELKDLSPEIKNRLIEAVKNVELNQMPKLIPMTLGAE